MVSGPGQLSAFRACVEPSWEPAQPGRRAIRIRRVSSNRRWLKGVPEAQQRPRSGGVAVAGLRVEPALDGCAPSGAHRVLADDTELATTSVRHRIARIANGHKRVGGGAKLVAGRSVETNRVGTHQLPTADGTVGEQSVSELDLASGSQI